MGARLWKKISGLGVCFMLQWLAKFGTRILKFWCPYTTDEQLMTVKPWDALYLHFQFM